MSCSSCQKNKNNKTISRPRLTTTINPVSTTTSVPQANDKTVLSSKVPKVLPPIKG